MCGACLWQAHINLGLNYRDIGMLDAAAAVFEDALRANVSSQELFFNFGVVLQDQGADFVLRRVVWVVQASRAVVVVWCRRTGFILKANTMYNEALALDAEYIEPRMNIAALHHKYGDVAQAARQYRVVLQTPGLTADQESSVRKNLAQACLDLGDVESALQGI